MRIIREHIGYERTERQNHAFLACRTRGRDEKTQSIARSVQLKFTLGLFHMVDEGRNGADLDSPFPSKGNTGLASQHARAGVDSLSRHGFSVVHDLADDADLLLASQPAELCSGLGMASAEPHAAGTGLQGEDVARSTQGRRGSAGVGEHAAGQGTVVGADAGCDGLVGGVDGDGVGGAAGVLAAGYHLGELEVGGAGRGQRSADQAGGVADHEAHLLGGDILGGDDEVGLVLAGRVIEDDEELAIACWDSHVSQGCPLPTAPPRGVAGNGGDEGEGFKRTERLYARGNGVKLTLIYICGRHRICLDGTARLCLVKGLGTWRIVKPRMQAKTPIK